MAELLFTVLRLYKTAGKPLFKKFKSECFKQSKISLHEKCSTKEIMKKKD